MLCGKKEERKPKKRNANEVTRATVFMKGGIREAGRRKSIKVAGDHEQFK